MDKQLSLMEALVSQGFSEAVAASMLKVLEPKPPKKKRGYRPFGEARKKVNVPVVVIQTCLTCKSITSFKRVMQVWSDETEVEQNCSVGQCVNCIKQYELMPKEQLIALIVIMNHVDVELRNLSTATQIKMAGERSAIDWLTLKMNHAIAWSDRDEEGYVDMPDVKIWRK